MQRRGTQRWQLQTQCQPCQSQKQCYDSCGLRVCSGMKILKDQINDKQITKAEEIP